MEESPLSIMNRQEYCEIMLIHENCNKFPGNPNSSVPVSHQTQEIITAPGSDSKVNYYSIFYLFCRSCRKIFSRGEIIIQQWQNSNTIQFLSKMYLLNVQHPIFFTILIRLFIKMFHFVSCATVAIFALNECLTNFFQVDKQLILKILESELPLFATK